MRILNTSIQNKLRALLGAPSSPNSFADIVSVTVPVSDDSNKTSVFKTGSSLCSPLDYQTVRTAAGSQNVTAGTGYTALAVTAGKTFYLSEVIFWSNSAGDQLKVGDGSVATQLLNVVNAGTATNGCTVVPLTTPIKFNTSVFLDVGGAGARTINFSVVGWEE